MNHQPLQILTFLELDQEPLVPQHPTRPLLQTATSHQTTTNYKAGSISRQHSHGCHTSTKQKCILEEGTGTFT